MTNHPEPGPGIRSPLHDAHVAAGASFTDFAGWQMPVRYSSELDEHRAVRTAAGLFDLSHMAEILVAGPEAGAALDFALSGHISTLDIGQARYTLLLTPEGGVIDDVIVYRTHENRFGVVANAGNRFEAAGALSVRAVGFDTTVVDESEALALIAVQGPRAEEILLSLDGLDVPVPVGSLRNYRCVTGVWRGNEIMIARTGYTGEDGFELYIRVAFAQELWESLLEVGAPHGLIPAGLACRDTLRLEAGMPLYGHELGLDIRPQQVGLGRTVRLEGKGDFVGRQASEVPLPEGARLLVGLASEGRRAGRAGYAVFDSPEGGEPVGEVTSGALSPTLGHPIAMAFVDRALSEPGTPLYIDVRGTRIAASVTSLPFYKRSTPQRKVAP
ncbi:glycine cleavage system aminomethyltransferase GcvT [Salinibacterium sp. SYSU T00001]|uniref:glycine cleavage system aminomethyltransferase GcvT n=1 Tax=Homoserinimonas sedimenticola TaxID=2986805 RepID=UPI0022366EBC|nr:glycine cleavage system aminomethyltransferase GcvT [Salinibacterium sedimenticola]MCW4386486.1 glycine cleavage system aminomethyltransferase GcvT [Salinibacterium sedimenticola]